MQEVWAEWKNGKKELVDSADSEAEALYLVQEHKTAYGDRVRQVWTQLSRKEEKDVGDIHD